MKQKRFLKLLYERTAHIVSVSLGSTQRFIIGNVMSLDVSSTVKRTRPADRLSITRERERAASLGRQSVKKTRNTEPSDVRLTAADADIVAGANTSASVGHQRRDEAGPAAFLDADDQGLLVICRGWAR